MNQRFRDWTAVAASKEAGLLFWYEGFERAAFLAERLSPFTHCDAWSGFWGESVGRVLKAVLHGFFKAALNDLCALGVCLVRPGLPSRCAPQSFSFGVLMSSLFAEL